MLLSVFLILSGVLMPVPRQASRFHLPLFDCAFDGPGAHILSLLRLSPSPRHLVQDALLPTLLNSAFADRLFYSPFLSLATLPTGTRPRVSEDGPSTAILVCGLLRVARDMLAAITSTAQTEDLDPHSVGRMVCEVCGRLASQLRAAVPLWVARIDDADSSAFEELRSDLADLVATLDAALAPSQSAGLDSVRNVLELGLVVELAFEPFSPARLAALVRGASLSSFHGSESESDATGSDSSPTLVRFLSRLLCPHRSAADLLRLCDRLEARDSGRAQAGAEEGFSNLGRALLLATLAAKGSDPFVREQVDARLTVRRTSSPAPAGTVSPASDGTDYNEPVVAQQRPCGKRRRPLASSSDSNRFEWVFRYLPSHYCCCSR